MKEFYKIIGPIGEVNFVNLKRIVVVEFVEEEHLIVFDGILKIKISARDYRCVRKDLLKELHGERTDFSYKSTPGKTLNCSSFNLHTIFN